VYCRDWKLILKKRIRRFTKFSKKIGKGLHVEMKETIDIPKHIKNREYKKAGAQVVDIFKMAGLTVIWVIPGGAVVTAMIVKFSHKARPSAFREIKKKNDAKIYTASTDD